MPAPLDFDPIKEAGRQWRERWGDDTVSPMMAVTSIMRVEQILIARLEAGGYVQRRPHPSDRRTTLAAITPRERGVAAAATEELNSSAFGTESLTGSQLDTVSELLGVLRLDAGDFADEPERPSGGLEPPLPMVRTPTI